MLSGTVSGCEIFHPRPPENSLLYVQRGFSLYDDVRLDPFGLLPSAGFRRKNRARDYGTFGVFSFRFGDRRKNAGNQRINAVDRNLFDGRDGNDFRFRRNDGDGLEFSPQGAIP